ncbi:hypothetical protein FHY18_004292 [Xanthomonas arboricola]|uniref:hypothetical protein n=1 Tax=Xanthomonas sp. 3793 TaxID=3035312 RepID=UPI0021681149|nr:hypothetical protein [Xanthomonas sp. 3793]MCS3748653.1 hypothetical protein [Xanthomonas sp. 3793]
MIGSKRVGGAGAPARTRMPGPRAPTVAMAGARDLLLVHRTGKIAGCRPSAQTTRQRAGNVNFRVFERPALHGARRAQPDGTVHRRCSALRTAVLQRENRTCRLHCVDAARDLRVALQHAIALLAAE